MRHHKGLIFYLAAVLCLALAYLASLGSEGGAWQLFPGLGTMLEANAFITALMFLLISVALAFLAFPSMPMVYMAAGFYMDGLVGGATVLLGSAIGGFSAFLFYRKQIRHSLSTRLDQYSAFKLWLTLLGLRLSPLVPAPLANFFAAVLRVSPFQYLTTSLLGNAPLVLVYAQIGQQGHHFWSGTTPHWYEFSGYVIILIVSTLLSAFGPWRLVLNELKRLRESSELKAAPLQAATSP
jgi:uncharacterized membrane protein YdjX (TVP38/TMEM64 family)